MVSRALSKFAHPPFRVPLRAACAARVSAIGKDQWCCELPNSEDFSAAVDR